MAAELKDPCFIPNVFYVIVQDLVDGNTKFIKDIWVQSKKDENGELEIGRPYEITKTDEIHEAKVYERLDDALIVIYALTKAFKTNVNVKGFRVYQFEETLKRVEQIP